MLFTSNQTLIVSPDHQVGNLNHSIFAHLPSYDELRFGGKDTKTKTLRFIFPDIKRSQTFSNVIKRSQTVIKHSQTLSRATFENVIKPLWRAPFPAPGGQWGPVHAALTGRAAQGAPLFVLPIQPGRSRPDSFH